jgi:hypothetical protein
LEDEQHITQWSVVHGRNKGGNKKFLQFNWYEITNSQNLWATEKTDLRGKFVTIQAFIFYYKSYIIWYVIQYNIYTM